MTNEETLEQYTIMPDELVAALAGLSDSDLDLKRKDDAWTIRQIAHHIVDADEMTKTIIKAALGDSGCAFGLEWYDPNNKWATTLQYAARPVEPAIEVLRANHREMEELLRSLDDCWARYVLLKRFKDSDVRELTVSQLIQSQTSHAFHHIEQIRETRLAHGL